jgi:SprB repeat
MYKKILPLIVVALTLGFTAQTQAQSVTVTIAGSASGTPLTFGTPSKTDITCNGAANGTVTAVATGGTGAITYAIALVSAPTVPIASNATGTFTGLAAGTYVVGAATTSSCTATSTPVTVAEPTALTVSVTASTNATCFGTSTGTITAVAAGHTGASSSGSYAYTITGGNTTGATTGAFTGLAAGTYTVTVTKNTCTASTTPATTLTEPAQLAASFSPATVQIACGATTASSGTVTVTCGTTAYSYAWTVGTGAAAVPSGTAATSAPALTAGTYNVAVTDANGCTTTPALTVVTITAPNATLSATVTPTQIVCNAGSPGAAGSTKGSIAVTAVLPGAASPTYAWSNSTTAATATNLDAGTYMVTISAVGYCPVDYSSTINAAPAIVSATSGSLVDDGCQTNTGSVVLTGTGGTSPYQMKWVSAILNPATPARPAAAGSPNQNVYTSAAATGSFTGLTGGYDYKFVIRDSAGCTTPE